ncbi:MAG: L-seryl-tRNA(Sec) selenium transferase [Armatimonadetes bacterium]|nr:L-seryl-tRNA(Sec) selenium transferase [Armatimonadota bacterium]
MVSDLNKSELLRQLPAVHEVLQAPPVAGLLAVHPRAAVTEAVRAVLDRVRRQVAAGEGLPAAGEAELLFFLVREVVKAIEREARPNLRRVINATGVVLHTNLGRAVLSAKAQQAIQMAASGYTNLELNLETGRRGSRYAAVEGIITRLTGAEAALVVNNNAAAVLLALGTLAGGKEVIVSRGQLIEIGGSFRIPDVMRQSGAVLVEVGTTNKTYPDDYRRAISERTGLLLHVHTSNYRIVGFTRETTVAELVELGREFGLPVMSDLGSGVLIDLEPFGLPGEPTVQQVVEAGADVVTFSGDKLLGGPQAGIIAGKKDLLARMKKNPLTRALRIDKFTVAALEATLRAYLDLARAAGEIPVLKMLTAGKDALEPRARELARLLAGYAGGRAEITVEQVISRVGGGALPTAELPSFAVTVRPADISAEELSRRLRKGNPAVLGRIQEDLLLLDVRTLQEGEDEPLAGAVKNALEADLGMDDDDNEQSG